MSLARFSLPRRLAEDLSDHRAQGDLVLLFFSWMVDARDREMALEAAKSAVQQARRRAAGPRLGRVLPRLRDRRDDWRPRGGARPGADRLGDALRPPDRERVHNARNSGSRWASSALSTRTSKWRPGLRVSRTWWPSGPRGCRWAPWPSSAHAGQARPSRVRTSASGTSHNSSTRTTGKKAARLPRRYSRITSHASVGYEADQRSVPNKLMRSDSTAPV